MLKTFLFINHFYTFHVHTIADTSFKKAGTASITKLNALKSYPFM